jgi:spore coat protein JB
MPSCAPLATGYVPFQQAGSQRYAQKEALSNGTLYPALNLPFHLKIQGSTLPDNMLTDLQALDFVILELGTYLDTHPEDAEAFALFKQYVETARTARDAYERANGPLKRKAAAKDDRYTWLRDPWPWNFEENEVK